MYQEKCRWHNHLPSSTVSAEWKGPCSWPPKSSSPYLAAPAVPEV